MAKKKTPIQHIKIVNETVQSRTASFFSRLGAMLGMSHDGKRDIYNIYGYDESLSGDQGFRRMYGYSRRQGIANRITWGIAKTCWRDGFGILSDPDEKESKQLEEELIKLSKRGLNKALERADILNRIGRFSLLFVGVPDGRKLNEPLGRVNVGDGFKSLYFRSYAYDGVTITSWDTDEESPRFGLPVIYQVQKSSNRGQNEKDNAGMGAINIHYTRIIHLNENALDSDIEGMGALEPVFNRILDLDKSCGGSAEAYFRNAKGKIAYEIDKEFATSLNDPDTRASFNEGVEKYTNKMQDHTTAIGAKVKTLPTPHASPLDTVKVLLWEIAGYTGLRIRILTGEGAGQMAGSEDQLSHNQIIADRQRLFCADSVVQVLQMLDFANMLKFDDTWVVDFPPQKATTEMQQSEINNKNSATLKNVTDAKTSIGGDSLDLDSALDMMGLGEIKTDNFPPDDDDDDDNEDESEEV